MRHLDVVSDVVEIRQAAYATVLRLQGNYEFSIPKTDQVHEGDSVLFNFPCAVSNYQMAIACHAYDTATIKRGKKVIFAISGEKAKDLERRLLEEIRTTTEKK